MGLPSGWRSQGTSFPHCVRRWDPNKEKEKRYTFLVPDWTKFTASRPVVWVWDRKGASARNASQRLFSSIILSWPKTHRVALRVSYAQSWATRKKEEKMSLSFPFPIPDLIHGWPLRGCWCRIRNKGKGKGSVAPKSWANSWISPYVLSFFVILAQDRRLRFTALLH